jgi:hypothetical protein
MRKMTYVINDTQQLIDLVRESLDGIIVLNLEVTLIVIGILL